MRTTLLMLRLIHIFVQLVWYTRVILIEFKDNKTAQLIIFNSVISMCVNKHHSIWMFYSIRISVKSDYLLYCRDLLVCNNLLRNSHWNPKLTQIFYNQELNWFFNIVIIFSQNNGVFFLNIQLIFNLCWTWKRDPCNVIGN